MNNSNKNKETNLLFGKKTTLSIVLTSITLWIIGIYELYSIETVSGDLLKAFETYEGSRSMGASVMCLLMASFFIEKEIKEKLKDLNLFLFIGVINVLALSINNFEIFALSSSLGLITLFSLLAEIFTYTPEKMKNKNSIKIDIKKVEKADSAMDFAKLFSAFSKICLVLSSISVFLFLFRWNNFLSLEKDILETVSIVPLFLLSFIPLLLSKEIIESLEKNGLALRLICLSFLPSSIITLIILAIKHPGFISDSSLLGLLISSLLFYNLLYSRLNNELLISIKMVKNEI